MTITQRVQFLQTYMGKTKLPVDFASHWHNRIKQVTPAVTEAESVDLGNDYAVYENLTVSCPNGRTVRGRYIRPVGEGPFPTVLMFHDLDRGVRGWHHTTRFISFGYAVAALEAEPTKANWHQNPFAPDFENRYLDAFAFADAVCSFPQTQCSKLVTWGEGFGGGLAMAVAAMLRGSVSCAALHPMPADFRGLCGNLDEDFLAELDYLDVANFAALLKGELLLGTCLMDKISLPEGQYAAYHSASCIKNHKIYPKFEHERVKDFEDELMILLHRISN